MTATAKVTNTDTLSCSPIALAPQDDRFLYGQLAQRLEHRIRDGSLRVGSKLPSVRTLSRESGVSVSTVVQAYVQLENKGLIEGRPRSGYFVAVSRQLPEPTISHPVAVPQSVDVTDFVHQVFHNLHNPNLVPFGVATVSPAWLPHSKLNVCLRKAVLNFPLHSSKYEGVLGHPPLRREIAKLCVSYGCDISPDDVVVTSGAMEALSLAIHAVANSGDVVAVESPTYFGILQLLEIMRVKAVEIPTCPTEGMELEPLERALKKHRIRAIITMTNCQNPLGFVMPDAKKKELLKLAATHDVPIIEDDVYGDLAFSERRPAPLKAFDRNSTVIMCSAFSKTVAPGFRIGWMYPGRFKQKVELMKSVTTLGAPALQQLALADFLRTGGYQRHLRTIRNKLSNQAAIYSHRIAEWFPAETRISRPQGGNILWVELPPGVDSRQLYINALKSGIGIIPGPIFSSSQAFRNFVRITFGHMWTPRTERALKQLGTLTRELMA